MALFKTVAKCLGLSLAGNVSAAVVSLSYEPVWQGLGVEGAAIPIRVEVKNSGQDTIGTITAISPFGSQVYPVELPRGADKVLTVYLPPSNSYSPTSLELKTTNGNVTVEVELNGESGQDSKIVGVISPSSGLLASLRAKKVGKSIKCWDTYCKPGLAPDRSVGYSALDAVVLAEGTEQLSDLTVSALQRYVLRGGELIVTGGASAPWLLDPRWQPILPLRAASTKTILVPALSKRTDEPLSQPITLTIGSLKPGVRIALEQDGIPVISEMQVGLGRVTFWAFDPFSGPVRTWRGRDVLISQLLSETNTAEMVLSDNASPRHVAVVSDKGEASDDPFMTKMPPAWKVTLILLSFIVVVVPVNFFVLQKLNRREWAWTSIPLISLAFSAMIFATASGLYGSSMARATNGTVITHDGLDQAIFIGDQEIFLPQAGVYDLGFSGVESAHNSSRQYDMWNGRAKLGEEAEIIDVGQVIVPRLEATNLTFRNLALTQAVPITGRLTFNPVIKTRPGGWTITGRMTNTTSVEISDARLMYQGGSSAIGDIGAGQTKMIEVQIDKTASRSGTGDLQPQIRNGLALYGRGEGLTIGTSLGVEPKAKRGCKFLYTWSEK